VDVPVLAGSAATVVFAASILPMLAKAWRTRDVASYSVGNIVLANLGNLLYTVYVLQLPAGPVWALHAFHTLSTALMLVWYVRYVVLRNHARRSVHPMRARRESSITTVRTIPSSRPRPG
jgi:uncharacterized protein with PQ loop repeat